VGEGMYIRDALKTLNKCGDVPAVDLQGNHECDEAMANVNADLDDLKTKAYPHRISSYAKLHGVADIKTALMKHGCVIISMPWHADAKLKNNIYTHSSNENRGYHAVMVYGWNEQGWLVQNSWGEYWGDNGTFILPYDVELKEAWCVVDNIANNGDIIKPNDNFFVNKHPHKYYYEEVL
jgi:C1A family cysteine protease